MTSGTLTETVEIGRTQRDRRQVSLILVIGLALALVLRLWLSAGGGNAWDLEVYKGWANTIAERGAAHAYDGPVIVDYPPVFLYWLDIGGRVYRALVSPEFDTNRPEMTYLIRLPGLVLDLVLGVMIYVFVNRRGGPWPALAAALGYLFNPGVVFDLAYWGMPDSPHAVLIVAALWLALSGKPFWAWAVITIGVFTKPQADIFAPLVALITLRDGGIRACLRGSFGISAGLLVSLAPFLVAGTIGGVLDQFLRMADYDPFISNNAHNIWWLVGWGYGGLIRDTEPFLGPVSYRATALALLLGFVTFALVQTWRHRKQAETVEIAAYVGLVLFMVMTVVHENHVYAVLPLLSLVWWKDRRLLVLYLVISVAFLLNLVLHDPTIYDSIQAFGLHRRLIGLTLANALTFLAVLVWWTSRLSGLRFLSPVGSAATWAPGRALAVLMALGVAGGGMAFALGPKVAAADFDPSSVDRQSDAVFGGQIRLLGYQVRPERVAPGGAVQITMYWKALRDLDQHYMLFAHLLDRQLQSGGQEDGPPTRNLYPTRYWREGEVIRDERTVLVSRNARPGIYQVEVGFYPLTDFRRLTVETSGRKDDKVVVGQVIVPFGAVADPARLVNLDLGDAVRLVGFAVRPAIEAPLPVGGTLSLDFVWLARSRTTTDYTVFVQLIAEDGRPASQFDSQPLSGRYPTSIWVPGERVLDAVGIQLPTAPGSYRLIAGMYDLRTGARLPADNADFADLGLLQVR